MALSANAPLDPGSAGAAPPVPAPATQPQAEPQPPRPNPLHRPETDDPPDPANLPTLEQMQAEIRRRPVGRAIADICRDLGIAPRLCEGSFWNAVSSAIMWYRGNPPKLMQDFRRRQVAFESEMDADPFSACRSKAATASAACWASSSASAGHAILGADSTGPA